MRTKQCESVMRLDIGGLDPRVEIEIAYDGLGGISQRSILRDIVEELHYRGAGELRKVLEALTRHGGTVRVSFADYVSYGIGGGDATAEFPLGVAMLLWYEAETPKAPAQLVLRRNSPLSATAEVPEPERIVERMSLDGVLV